MAKADAKTEGVKVARNYGKEKAEDVDLSNPFAIFKLLAPPKAKASKKPKMAVIYAVGEIVTGQGRRQPVRRRVGRRLDDHDRGDPRGGEGRDGQGDRAAGGQPRRVGPGQRPDLAGTGRAARSRSSPAWATWPPAAGTTSRWPRKKIYAEPGTLTGSIGVVGGKIVTGGLFDWVGMKTDVISRGANSGCVVVERRGPSPSGRR